MRHRAAADDEVEVTGKPNRRHPIDRHAGARMRSRRIELRLSQVALARRLGVTFQAVQKYEAGTVGLSAGRLYELARALEVVPGFFFEAYDEEQPAALLAMPRRDGAALLKGYYGIRDPALQADLRRLVARLGQGEPEEHG